MLSIVVAIILSSCNPALGYDVLMVIGGMSTANRYSSYHKSVEIVDINKVCLSSALPHPLFGAGAGKLRDRVVVCGGFDGTFERRDCWQYDPSRKRWSYLTNLPHNRGLLFPGTVTNGENELFLVGGRSYNQTTRSWDYLTDVWKFNVFTLRWTRLPSLEHPTAEGCLLSVNEDLFFIGGAKGKFRYADDPSKVWVLQSRERFSDEWKWRDDLIPPIIGPRTWHGCVLTTLENEAGILISGGYHTGRLSMFFKLEDDYLRRGVISPGNGRWETAGWLPAQRQWGPSFGLIAGVPTIVAGMDYGDETMDEFHGWNDWRRADNKRLRYKREFSAAVTVPNYWFTDDECST